MRLLSFFRPRYRFKRAEPQSRKLFGNSPLLFFALFSSFLLSPTPEARSSPQIQDLLVETRDGSLFVSARLRSGFQKKTVEDIHNGIPKNFYYYFVLHKKEKRWFDEELLSKTIRYTVKYDTLKKHYTVTRTDDQNTTETTVSEFEAMKEMVTRIKHQKLTTLEGLNKTDHLYVSVKSQMQAVKRPFYVDYFLFFIPFLEIDTPWVDSPRITFSEEK